jgi:hypothetical protein
LKEPKSSATGLNWNASNITAASVIPKQYSKREVIEHGQEKKKKKKKTVNDLT